jgi:diacylglycerol kinase family enzyme
MSEYDYIGVIYSPNSTGDAEKLAKSFARAVEKHGKSIGQKVQLVPTKRAGHAIELARALSKKYKRPLIVSSSGDGGYNELINGVMQAKKQKRSAAPVVAVLAAGNANDHKRVMRGDSKLIELLLHSHPKPLDLLYITAGRFERYAHSYIGFGITSSVGAELDSSNKGLAGEAGLAARTIVAHEPIQVERNGRTRRYDSMVFANINEMAKVVRLNARRTVTDGKFELVLHRHYGAVRSALSLLRTALFGAQRPRQFSSYSFRTNAPSVQCDGEVNTLPTTSMLKVTITSVQHAVESLYN